MYLKNLAENQDDSDTESEADTDSHSGGVQGLRS